AQDFRTAVQNTSGFILLLLQCRARVRRESSHRRIGWYMRDWGGQRFDIERIDQSFGAGDLDQGASAAIDVSGGGGQLVGASAVLAAVKAQVVAPAGPPIAGAAAAAFAGAVDKVGLAQMNRLAGPDLVGDLDVQLGHLGPARIEHGDAIRGERADFWIDRVGRLAIAADFAGFFSQEAFRRDNLAV